MKQNPLARALAKVPADVITVHRAAVEILVIISPNDEGEAATRWHNKWARENTWDVVLDLRDMVERLEHRYPVLKRIKTRRPCDGDPSRN